MFKAHTAIFAAAVLGAATAHAAIVVDGNYDAAYGAATATVAYDPAAPDSNFSDPTNASKFIGYSIFLKADNGAVYGYLRADPSVGASAGAFANVYFDIDPKRAVPNGSDIGFELGATSHNVFVAGTPGTVVGAGIVTAVSADQLGVEFKIPNSFFTTPVAGLTYYGNEEFPSVGGPVTLRLSQSFGYSVAGGATYGNDRLGSVTLAAASPTPEPAAWALMIGGFGLVGAAARRRRSTLAA